MKGKVSLYKSWIENQHAIILLVSLLFFLFVGPLIQNKEFSRIFYNIVMLLIAISGFVLIPKNRRGKLFLLLFYLNLLTTFLDLFQTVRADFLISNLVWSIFFLKVLTEIFRLSLAPKNTSSNAILNSISGYIILGIIGAVAFDFLQELDLKPFKVDYKFPDLIYYSFVTMTTLGYGDISPVFKEGKALAIALTIAGQLYITVVIAINIAKYLNQMTKESEEKKFKTIDEKLDRLLEQKEK
ncbi:MAG: two pore domain potassium channel family protein [Crocinitomicaceae bacterium]|nr:two pore domain potassium channel family protein [Crocinitomicaceae bacterium]